MVRSRRVWTEWFSMTEAKKCTHSKINSQVSILYSGLFPPLWERLSLCDCGWPGTLSVDQVPLKQTCLHLPLSAGLKGVCGQHQHSQLYPSFVRLHSAVIWGMRMAATEGAAAAVCWASSAAGSITPLLPLSMQCQPCVSPGEKIRV